MRMMMRMRMMMMMMMMMMIRRRRRRRRKKKIMMIIWKLASGPWWFWSWWLTYWTWRPEDDILERTTPKAAGNQEGEGKVNPGQGSNWKVSGFPMVLVPAYSLLKQGFVAGNSHTLAGDGEISHMPVASSQGKTGTFLHFHITCMDICYDTL